MDKSIATCPAARHTDSCPLLSEVYETAVIENDERLIEWLKPPSPDAKISIWLWIAPLIGFIGIILMLLYFGFNDDTFAVAMCASVGLAIPLALGFVHRYENAVRREKRQEWASARFCPQHLIAFDLKREWIRRAVALPDYFRVPPKPVTHWMD